MNAPLVRANVPVASARRVDMGEVACIFACDVACEMPRQVIGTLLSQRVRRFGFDAQNHHTPRKPLFCRPDTTRLPAQAHHRPQGPV